jgi:hypothetical protein
MNFEIIVITNTFHDLSKFDFEFVDLKILDIESKEFREYIAELNPRFDPQNFSFFQSIIDESHNIKENKRYAIFKKNHKENYELRNLYVAYQLLLIIFPSELIIEHSVTFEDEAGFVQRVSMSSRQNNYSYEYDYLYYDDENLPLINEFIALTFERTKSTSYIGLAIENYVNSYTASHLHFQFITFCMALENIIPGAQELSYRLKRSVAIICGNDKNVCRRIYKNIDTIYKVRSKIVHGDKFDLKAIEPSLIYLNAIVSLLIIELLVHNVDTNIILGERITEIGFGDRILLSENWKEYKLNPITYNQVKYKVL